VHVSEPIRKPLPPAFKLCYSLFEVCYDLPAVLDEFDVLFNDKRGKPSDFIYKLLVMEEKLREKGVLACIVAVSNNVMADYEVDDRVRSRIGSSEVFFPAYTKKDALDILKDRAAKARSVTSRAPCLAR
jgi:Cdc6-like AAA superfamily ATPase